MFPEMLSNLTMVALFAVPVLVGVLSLFVKRWRGRGASQIFVEA